MTNLNNQEIELSAEQALKKTVADNIIMYRKACGLTQLQLAEKLNYSDKAISKWERGESLPDLYILTIIADMFGITLNDLVTKQDKPIKTNKKSLNKVVVTLLSVGVTWLVAFIVYVILSMASINMAFMSFLYAIPVSLIVFIVFSKIFKSRLCVFLGVSGLFYSIPLSICVQLNWEYNSHYLFLVAIPLQILTILWFMRKIEFKRAN